MVLIGHHVTLIAHGWCWFLLGCASQREKLGRAFLWMVCHRHDLLARFDIVCGADPLHGLIGDKLHKVADILMIGLLLLVWTILARD